MKNRLYRDKIALALHLIFCRLKQGDSLYAIAKRFSIPYSTAHRYFSGVIAYRDYLPCDKVDRRRVLEVANKVIPNTPQTRVLKRLIRKELQKGGN